MLELSLRDRVAIITGASRGIGRSLAETFAAAGAHLLLSYHQDDEAATALARELAAYDVETQLVKGSVADPEVAASLAEQAMARWGRIDCLINNAGITRDTYLGLMKPEQWHEVIDVNLNALYYCSKAVSKKMIARRRGSILNLSSVSAVTGRAGQTNYAAAKAGALGFTRSLARELGRYDVRVNALIIGVVETDMTRRLPRKVLSTLISQTPLGRLGKPREIAAAALFLASDLASFVTGSCIEVTGGL